MRRNLIAENLQALEEHLFRESLRNVRLPHVLCTLQWCQSFLPCINPVRHGSYAAFCLHLSRFLVAGKGHENYQEIKGVKHHFDDKEILKEIFK